MLSLHVLIEVVIGIPKFFGLPCPVSHLQQWQCQNLAKGENTPYFPRYSGEHLIFFLLKDFLTCCGLPISYHLRAVSTHVLTQFHLKHNELRDRWESYILSSRKGEGDFIHTHTPTTPNHLKPPTMKKVNCISKVWKCQIPRLTEWQNTVPVAIYH